MKLAGGQPSQTFGSCCAYRKCWWLFLIPAEIRLEIYSYLLIASRHGLENARPRKRASKGVILEIWEKMYQEKMIAIKCTNNRFEDDECPGLTPQIFRTCKSIHREATPTLYGATVFHFPLEPGYMSGDLPVYLSRDRGHAEQPGLRALCRELYQKPGPSGVNEAFGVLHRSTFAMFLRQIGQKMQRALESYYSSRGGETRYLPLSKPGGQCERSRNC